MSTEKYIHDLTLMLMYLTRFSAQSRLPIPMQPMAWKGYDFDTLNTLEDEGLIAQGGASGTVKDGGADGGGHHVRKGAAGAVRDAGGVTALQTERKSTKERVCFA